jgi:hypothetical protein
MGDSLLDPRALLRQMGVTSFLLRCDFGLSPPTDMKIRMEDERPNLDLENFTQPAQELARVVMASPYLKLELFFGLEGFIARDPEGVRILTADVGVRTDKKTGDRVGALERLRMKKTHRQLPMPISVLAAKQVVLQYDQERAGLALRPYFFENRPFPEPTQG